MGDLGKFEEKHNARKHRTEKSADNIYQTPSDNPYADALHHHVWVGKATEDKTGKKEYNAGHYEGYEGTPASQKVRVTDGSVRVLDEASMKKEVVLKDPELLKVITQALEEVQKGDFTLKEAKPLGTALKNFAERAGDRVLDKGELKKTIEEFKAVYDAAKKDHSQHHDQPHHGVKADHSTKKTGQEHGRR